MAEEQAINTTDSSQVLVNPEPVLPEISPLSEYDVYLFNEGSHLRLYHKLGAHPCTRKGVAGTYFAVWAPNASRVSVIGAFNEWDDSCHVLALRGKSGIWESFVPGAGKGQLYKYRIISRLDNCISDKADPFSYFNEIPPKTASVIWGLDYQWQDGEWMKSRYSNNALHSPISVYEVHLGSWMRVPGENNRSLSYIELASKLVDYVAEMGFTHVELMPVMDHPFFGSWGYQVTGYYAPSANFGTPQELMYLIDQFHQRGIGVILDWVPSHFPNDPHGLGLFDGTHLYEHSDPRKGIHPDWNSYIFNYGRHEVQSFLLSSAFFWLDKYHADALRVDGVASMLYLDYSRKPGEWIPNQYGGRENIEATEFIRRLNKEIYGHYPDVQTIAEESTAWPKVSRPTYIGGLGFGMKWDMGWMHDILEYLGKDPIHRKYHHNKLTFRMVYAFNENFVLSLSHDEVVHGKKSLLEKMPGDEWQKFANLRLLLSFMYCQPGKKLLFMGDEFGQRQEWNHDSSLEWNMADHKYHNGIQQLVKDLNKVYATMPVLYSLDFDSAGFEWIDYNDSGNSVVSFLRRGTTAAERCLAICNFTPRVLHNYRIGVPEGGFWKELVNSDSSIYGGSGEGNLGNVRAAPEEYHGRPYSLNLTLPPLATLILVPNDSREIQLSFYNT